MTQTPPQFIVPAQLRIGMYIYLDLGWMDHPFPVNSFEIRSQEQIRQVQALGLSKIRYSPEKSIAKPNTLIHPPLVAEPDKTVAVTMTESRHHKALLHDQQSRLQACEKQFALAAQSYRHLTEILYAQPESAKQSATGIVKNLLDGILSEEEATIRLLGDKVGEKIAIHSVNVTVMSLLLGKALALPKEDMLELGIGALLHDMGKLEIPDRLRWIDEHNSAAERQLYENHVSLGVSLARKMQLTPSTALLIAQHHEFADGSGFPSQIHANKMTGLSRILSLVNHFDNLCNPSNIAQALTPHEALSLLFTKNKARSDPTTLTAFIKLLGIYPPGSVVQLSDERYAIVVSVNSSRTTRPRVIIHDANIPSEDAIILNLEDEAHLGIRRNLKPAQLPKTAFDYLAPRQRLSYFFESTIAAGAELRV